MSPSSHRRPVRTALLLTLVLALVFTAGVSAFAAGDPVDATPQDEAGAPAGQNESGGTPPDTTQTLSDDDGAGTEASGEGAGTPSTPEGDGATGDSADTPDDPAADGTVSAILIGEQTVITDTVSYEGLRVGTQYTLNGVLMDAETKQPLQLGGENVTAQAQFTPDAATGTATVTFTLDSRSLAGKTLVVFEELYEGDFLLTSHKDIADEAQTVRFAVPSIGTKAAGDGEARTIRVGTAVTVTDTVSYQNLKPGVEYTVSGTLMDKAGHQPLMNGENPITSTATFTPDAKDGETTVTFTFDASVLGGKKGVVYEEVLAGGVIIAEHKDITDEDQTVEFIPPEITTSAVGPNGAKKLKIGGSTTITDTVTYKNARPGQEFTVDGVLMLKGEDGEEPTQLLVGGQPVTGTATATADESGSGTVDVTYTFNSMGLSGRSVVVYEQMRMNGNTVASHEDIEDAKQTVSFEDMEIGTVLVADGESHDSTLGASITLTDHVSFTNLVPGDEYELRATLVDRSGNPITVGEAPVTATQTFRPETADGTQDVTFTFDARALDGKSVVAFEELWSGDIKLGEHKDPNDSDQTVTFKGPKISTSATGAAEDTVRIAPEAAAAKEDSLGATGQKILTDLRQTISERMENAQSAQ